MVNNRGRRFFTVILFAAVFFVTAAFPAAAQEGPHRIVEVGFDLDVALANNMAGLGDVFNARKAVVLDFRKLRVTDITAWAGAEAGFFVNVNPRDSLSFGVFAGVDGAGELWLSQDLVRLLKEGNFRTRSIEGSMTLGAAAFAQAGLNAAFPIKKLRITVRPEVYMPLFYIPPPDFSYALTMDEDTGSITLAVGGGAELYSAMSLEEGAGMDIFGSGAPSIGADLSAGVEYSLLPKWDVGLTLTHIPVVPSSLNHRARISLELTKKDSDEPYQIDSIYDSLTGDSLTLPDFKTKTTYDDRSLTVLRPLRLDLFAEYRPLGIDLFTVRPNIGLSFLTIYGGSHISVNFGLEGRINLLRCIFIGLSTALREEVWRQSFSFGLNFRAVEFNLGLSLAGTDFLSSFNGKGVGVRAGLRLGY
ncbi:MAG: hypothetical protein LBG76_10130 [Treponema sp.]|jgi:hypothetical protein|nr:hypothetical protein [Treponema sp.]